MTITEICTALRELQKKRSGYIGSEEAYEIGCFVINDLPVELDEVANLIEATVDDHYFCQADLVWSSGLSKWPDDCPVCSILIRLEERK